MHSIESVKNEELNTKDVEHYYTSKLVQTYNLFRKMNQTLKKLIVINSYI